MKFPSKAKARNNSAELHFAFRCEIEPSHIAFSLC